MVAETTRAFGWALPWVLLCCVSPLPCEAGYTITGLGNLGGPGSVAYGMNDHGEIVGDSFATDGKKHAFLYTNGMMNDLGTFGGTESIARSINNNGDIVGSFQVVGVDRAFLYTGGTFVNLGSIVGGANSAAYGVNDAGQITGMHVPSRLDHAFIYAGSVTSVAVPGAIGTYAFDINSAGTIVGYYDARIDGTFQSRAIAYAGDSITTLPTLGGSHGSAYAINDVGHIVGESFTAAGQLHAFLFTTDGIMDLGTLGGNRSQAFDINNEGLIVGSAWNSDGKERAFLYSDGVMIDLNDLLPEESGWELISARAVNIHGQIAGWGRYQGEQQAFLLSPEGFSSEPAPPTTPDSTELPEPASMMVWGVGFAGMVLAAARRRRARRALGGRQSIGAPPPTCSLIQS